MASEKQNAANRRNGKKGGPKTARGKAHSRMNALKHGLRAEAISLPDENPADFEAFRDDAFQDLAPEGFIEVELAGILVQCLWRRRQCARIAAGLLGGGSHVMDEIAAIPDKKKNVAPSDIANKLVERCKNLEKVVVHQLETAIGCNEDKADRSQKAYDTELNGEDSLRVSMDEDLTNRIIEIYEGELQRHPATYDIALAFQKDMSQQEALLKLARYEAGFDREFHRALHHFRDLQAARKAEAAATATVIAVSDPGQDEHGQARQKPGLAEAVEVIEAPSSDKSERDETRERAETGEAALVIDVPAETPKRPRLHRRD